MNEVPIRQMLNTLETLSIVYHNIGSTPAKTTVGFNTLAQLEHLMNDIIQHLPEGQVA